jgi:hypothetical protein
VPEVSAAARPRLKEDWWDGCVGEKEEYQHSDADVRASGRRCRGAAEDSVGVCVDVRACVCVRVCLRVCLRAHMCARG